MTTTTDTTDSGSAVSHGLTKVLGELGLVTVWRASRDVKLLGAQRFVRMFAYGCSTLILVSYLKALDISEQNIGLFMTLTLFGDVFISFFLTLFADTMGRRAVLILGSFLMAGSGVIFGLFNNYWILLAAAVFGVISPSGNDIGPFRAVEESTLAHLTLHEHLGDIFTWYSLIGTAGTALGMMSGGWIITFLQSVKGWNFETACRAIFFGYGAIGVVKLFLSLGLSHNVEAEEKQKKKTGPLQGQQEATETQPLLGEQSTQTEQPKKRGLFASADKALLSLIIKLFLLFGLDSFASGLAALSWMTYFFKVKFDLPEGNLGSIFFTTSLISAASMLVSSSIAKRIGYVRAMVFTHLPSTICLALIPVPNSLPLALTFLVLRACSQNMDVAPRAAFLASALPSDKRTAIMGSVNVVKTTAQSAGPYITGFMADHGLFGWSFTVAGILKVVYDLGMLFTFAGTEPAKKKPASTEEGEVEN
ncbi:hypothetical protein ASPZODRAFT_128876 [Penicilliopsis zonata CBS 506.65]|uniref:Major facilitator superfamily (MFS) profile domain-containing protein n=1 Tax=Penicilliopsis zonata CBS 506.65 TaxID=1073090 RepID=A0A1L9SSR7_9EURO|nr:hypothetical protein ASPZODRAFT_128876 [Penicilliopsis zonata CBS 506.65]OJJ50248.1 hypothetical protein ASPZODRAFT_128876 [Penicilliopsis zonata CBS 506.65]